jgi:hypothetical protein
VPTDRPSKQKRAAENRARRQALAARRENAQHQPPPAPAKRGRGRGRTASTGPLSSASSTSRQRPPASGGLFGKLLGGGASAADLEMPDPDDPTGKRAAKLALILAVLGVAGLAFFPVPVDSHGKAMDQKQLKLKHEEGEKVPTDPAITAVGPAIFVYGLPTLGAAAFALTGLKRPRRTRTLMVCLIASGAFILLNFGIGLLFLPSLVALFMAWRQVRQADMAGAPAAASPWRRPRPAARVEGVIEADVVDADDFDDVHEADDDVLDVVDADDTHTDDEGQRKD